MCILKTNKTRVINLQISIPFRENSNELYLSTSTFAESKLLLNVLKKTIGCYSLKFIRRFHRFYCMDDICNGMYSQKTDNYGLKMSICFINLKISISSLRIMKSCKNYVSTVARHVFSFATFFSKTVIET